MADGYELDYKKVHNTLGEPNDNKYGETIGQYITNLWQKGDKPFILTAGSDITKKIGWHYEGILTREQNLESNSDTCTYSTTTYFDFSAFPIFRDATFTVQIWLVDYNKTYEGSLIYDRTNSIWTTSITFEWDPEDPSTQPVFIANDTLHFKIIEIEEVIDSTPKIWKYDPLNYLCSQIIVATVSIQWLTTPLYFSNPIPLNSLQLCTIQHIEGIVPYYAIVGYDQQRDEYIFVNNDTQYFQKNDRMNHFCFEAPECGIVLDDGTHIKVTNDFDIIVDQWYIIFFNTNNPFTESGLHLCYNTSIPVVTSTKGLIVNDISDITPFSLAKYIVEIYDDDTAFNILRTVPPVTNAHGAVTPTRVSLPAEIKEDSKFQGWLKYKKYNLALITVRDHVTIKAHKYRHNNVNFTVNDKRYFILKYLRYSRLKLPTYEWHNTSLNVEYSFDSRDSSLATILSRRIPMVGNATMYTCNKRQIINQCQLCGKDVPEETTTHICFALGVVPQHGNYYNSDHMNNGSFIHEIPQDPNYYINNTIILTSKKE